MAKLKVAKKYGLVKKTSGKKPAPYTRPVGKR